MPKSGQSLRKETSGQAVSASALRNGGAADSAGRECNVQEAFLTHLRQSADPVTVFLVNGVKLQGIVSQFDCHTLLLRREGHVQLVYKTAISTIMPVGALPTAFEDALVECPAAGDF